MRAVITIVLVIIWCTSFAQKQGQSLIDSLHSALHHVKNDTARVNILDHLSYSYAEINPDSGLSVGKQAFTIAAKMNWQHGIAMSYSDIGVNYKAKSDMAKALEFQLKALKIYRQLGEKRSIAAIMQNIALVYHARSNYTKALEYDLDALKLFEEIADKVSMGITMENIGSLYLEQGNNDKTIDYYKAAAGINKTMGNLEGLARNLGNMGIVLNNKGNYNKALENHLSALEINRQTGNKYMVQTNLANIGLTYRYLKQYAKALKYNLEALEISKDLGNKNSIAINAGNIGELYFEIAKNLAKQNRIESDKNIQQSVYHLEWAIRLCRETGFAGPLTEFIPYLSEVYYQSGNYKKAHDYYKEYVSVKDSVFSIQSIEQMANLENKLKSDLQEKDMLLKKKQIRLIELEMQQRKDERVLYILGISMLILILGFATKSLINFQRTNKLLSYEKTKQRDLILNQNRDIQLRNRILEEIAHMQSHDIRGHVASILGLAQLFNTDDYSDSINKIVIDGINSSAEKLDKTIKEVVKKENDLNKGTA